MTMTTIATPGNVDSHHAVLMNDRPSFSIAPQSGVGGRIPRPRKLSAAPAMMAPGMPSVTRTMIGADTLGRTCRKTMRRSPHPATRAASTY